MSTVDIHTKWYFTSVKASTYSEVNQLLRSMMHLQVIWYVKNLPFYSFLFKILDEHLILWKEIIQKWESKGSHSPY